VWLHPEVLAVRNLGVIHQAALAGCKTFKYLHAAEQCFATKSGRTIWSIAHAFRGIRYACNYFMKLVFGYACKLHL
jgi:hypothetical protein